MSLGTVRRQSYKTTFCRHRRFMLRAFLSFWVAASAIVLLQPPKKPAPRLIEPRTATGKIVLAPGRAIDRVLADTRALRQRDGLIEEMADLVRSPWQNQEHVAKAPSGVERAKGWLSTPNREAAQEAVVTTDYDELSRTISISVTASGPEAARAYCDARLRSYAFARPAIVKERLVPVARALDAEHWAMLSKLAGILRRDGKLRDSPEFTALLARYEAGAGSEHPGRAVEGSPPLARRREREAAEMTPRERAYTLRERILALAQLRAAVEEELGSLPDAHRAGVVAAQLLPETEPDIHVIPKERSLVWAPLVASICAICASIWKESAARGSGARDG